MRLSIVTTLYRSSGFLEEFLARAVKAATALTDSFEIVMVNDGSPDDSLDKALLLRTSEKRISVVDLSRNFGHHRAMMVGLNAARGDYVFLIDCDLDEDPALLADFYEELIRRDCDVVYGVQASRQKRGHFDYVLGKLYYWLVDHLGSEKIPRNLTTVRLMTRRYVRNLTRFREREMIISRLWALTGFVQVSVEIGKAPQSRHISNYTTSRKMRMAVDHIVTSSNAPLYLIFYLGLGISLLSGVFLGYLALRYALGIATMAGWTSLLASVWMFGGLSLFTMSMIGIYVAHIFSETKNRPYAIVRHFYPADDSATFAPRAEAPRKGDIA